MKNTIAHDRHGFVLNGKRVFLLNGTIPYYRLHAADWGHHLDMLKASGYTGVDVYVPWNYHEPEPGAFDFATGNRDLGAFLDAIHARGLHAYLRPGPYICNEWDSGGLPQWLQRVPGLRIRENEPQYLECAARYLREICAIAAPRQFTRGGAVLLFAVENEYDFYPAQTDRNAYIARLRDVVRGCGIEIPLTACVGGGAAVRSATGLAAGVLPTPNYYFSTDVEHRVEDMRRHLLAQTFDDGAPMNNVPVFVTEMGRGEDDQLRVLSGGVKGLGPFNMSGGSHVGFWNGLTNWGGVTPISSAVDFAGITGFDGAVMRRFWETRRVAGFIHAFEPELLQCDSTHSRNADAPAVDNPHLGTPHHGQHDRRVYSLVNGDHGFIFLQNETKEPQPVRVTPYQQPAFPRAAPLTLASNTFQVLPLGVNPGRWEPQTFFRVLPFNIPLDRWGFAGAFLKHATGQVFAFEKKYGGAEIALWAEEDETFELMLAGSWQVPAPATNAACEPVENGVLLLLKTAREPNEITLLRGNKKLRVVWMNRAAAESRNLPQNLLRRRGVAAPIHSDWTRCALPMPPAPVETSTPRALPNFEPLESLNVDRGAAWYRCDVATPGLLPRATLVFERALDLVSVYWDGAFVGTQWGVGDPLTFNLPNAVKAGQHRLDIRTEIWGHANFHDTGNYATRLDAKRGIVGAVTLNSLELDGTWTLQAESSESSGSFQLPCPSLGSGTLPLRLPPGESACFTRELDRDYPLGAVLTLEGTQVHGEVWIDGWMSGRFVLGLLTPREQGGKIFMTAGPSNEFFLPGALARKGASIRLTTRANHPGGSMERITLAEITAHGVSTLH